LNRSRAALVCAPLFKLGHGQTNAQAAAPDAAPAPLSEPCLPCSHYSTDNAALIVQILSASAGE